MKTPLFPEGSSPTFSDYFKLDAAMGEILEEFDFGFHRKRCTLPRRDVDQALVEDLQRRWDRTLPYAELTNEVARREALIAPVVMEATGLTSATLRFEYVLKVDERLQGKIDYFVRAKHHVLIIEAKNGDPEGAFKQLAPEMIALDRWLVESDDPILYGAVSSGSVWQFGILDRAAKTFTQDLNNYGIPTQVGDVLSILTAILMNS